MKNHGFPWKKTIEKHFFLHSQEVRSVAVKMKSNKKGGETSTSSQSPCQKVSPIDNALVTKFTLSACFFIFFWGGRWGISWVFHGISKFFEGF